MSDVSTRMIIDLIRFLELKGHDRNTLLAPEKFPDLRPQDLSLSYLFDSRRSVPWNTFALILNSMEPYFESDEPIREFMQWSFDSGARWLHAVMPVAKLFFKPSSLYKIIEWGSKVNFSNMSIHVEVVSSREVQVEVGLRPEDRPCMLWIRFGCVCLGLLPAIAGFKPAQSSFTSADGKSAKIRVLLPPSGYSIVRSFFLQPLRILFGVKSLLNILNERDQELRVFHDEVVRAREAQEAVIAERTAQLAEANTHMATLMENVPDTIITIDRNKTITYINKVGPQFQFDKVLGACCLDFVPDEIKSAYEKVLDDAILKGVSGTIDLPVLGNTIWLTRVIPIFDNGVFQKLLVITTDITEARHSERRLEQAREIAVSASRAKSAFLANMSHEIRTPLSSIIGFGDLLSANTAGMSKSQINYCERILANSRHLLSLVNDVLDIAKIEAGTVSLANEHFFVGQLISDVMKMFALQASGKALALVDRSPEFSQVALLGDAQRLRQILINLVGNAIKFTDNGEVAICAVVLPGKHPKKSLLSISVSDTGCGIDRQKGGFLFEPFEQENLSISKQYGGTGLGLFLSRNIARIMGGDVTLVESTPGKGSVFVVNIEFESISPQITREQSVEKEEKYVPNESNQYKILVVEDNLDQAYLMQTRLEDAGYQSIFAHDGAAAVKTAVREKPDLIIMDLQMPVMDGFSAAKELHHLNSNIPIVALTAHASEKERDICMNLHFAEYWAKPIPLNSLLEGIDRVLISNVREALRTTQETP